MNRFLLFLLLLPFLLAGCGKDKPAQDAAGKPAVAMAVRVMPVRSEESAQPILAPGVISSESEQRLAFKTGGVIQKIYVEEGSVVKPGQLLAALNLTEINAQVKQAEEAVAKAERDLARVRNLLADSVATREQFQNATTALEMARQNLTIAKFNQGYSEIRATLGGKVLRKLMNEGELVGPGQPVFFVQSLAAGDWVIKVGLADRDWARVHAGDRAEIRLDAYPGEAIPTTVSQVADIADPATSTFKVEVRVPGGRKLASGLIGQVTIFPQQQGAKKAVPIEALLESNGTDGKIFVLENGVARLRSVQIAYLRGQMVVLASGLETDREVITAGAAYLKDGQAVSVVQ